MTARPIDFSPVDLDGTEEICDRRETMAGLEGGVDGGS
jgi:hypothetical protein